jgi:hypothetical protein
LRSQLKLRAADIDVPRVGGTIHWNSLIVVAALALALLWPKLQNRVDTTLVRDNP